MQSVDCMGTPADYIDLPGGPVQIVTRYSARAAEAAWGMFPTQPAGCAGTPSHCIDLPGVNPGKSLRATGRAAKTGSTGRTEVTKTPTQFIYCVGVCVSV